MSSTNFIYTALTFSAGALTAQAAPEEGHPYGDDGMVFRPPGQVGGAIAAASSAAPAAAASPEEGHPYGDDGMVFGQGGGAVLFAGVAQSDEFAFA